MIWNKDWRITATVFIMLVGVIIAAVVFIRNKDSITIREAVHVSMMGDDQQYDGKSKLEMVDGRMVFKNNKFEAVMEGQPVYSMESKKLYLTSTMSYMSLESNKIRKVNYYGIISTIDGIQGISKDGRKRNEINGGVLFDGRNTYLFLEPVTITYGENTMQLAAYSYITVVYKSHVTGYSYENKESFFSQVLSGDVMAESESGKFKLNLSADTMELENKTMVMMVPNPEVLKLIGEK